MFYMLHSQENDHTASRTSHVAEDLCLHCCAPKSSKKKPKQNKLNYFTFGTAAVMVFTVGVWGLGLKLLPFFNLVACCSKPDPESY